MVAGGVPDSVVKAAVEGVIKATLRIIGEEDTAHLAKRLEPLFIMKMF